MTRPTAARTAGGGQSEAVPRVVQSVYTVKLIPTLGAFFTPRRARPGTGPHSRGQELDIGYKVRSRVNSDRCKSPESRLWFMYKSSMIHVQIGMHKSSKICTRVTKR